MRTVIQHVVLCCLTSTQPTVSKVISVVSVPYSLYAKWWSVMCTHHIEFIPELAEEHAGCFCLWAVMRNAATNIYVQVFVRTRFLISSGYRASGGMAESHGDSGLSRLRSCRNVF